MTNLLDLST